MLRVRSSHWKIILDGALVLALAAFAIGAVAVVLLTRRVDARFAEPRPSVEWAAIEDVRLETSDGLALGAWYCAVEGSGPALVVLHGQKGSRTASLTRARLLAELGCPSLLVTLRAHGDSDGDANDFGWSARHDVAAGARAAALYRKRAGPAASCNRPGTIRTVDELAELASITR